jgi:hypothetical protein
MSKTLSLPFRCTLLHTLSSLYFGTVINVIKVQLKLDGEIPKRNCPSCPCQYTHATVLFSRACCDDDEDDDGNDDLITF